MERTTSLRALLSALCLIGWTVSPCLAESPAEQAIYWWQDELRVTAALLSEARTGQVAQWPQMAVPAGNLTLPLPACASPIQADGKLDEKAWEQATQFFVGPVFDVWSQGPFMLQVSVCRDKDKVYLALESPRDLTGLQSLSADGELFTVNGTPYHVGPRGGLATSSIGTTAAGQIIELALPITGVVNLTFAVETQRRSNGQLPPEAVSLGLPDLALRNVQRPRWRFPSLWFRPITVRLLPSTAAMRMAWSTPKLGQFEVSMECEDSQKPLEAQFQHLEFTPQERFLSVCPYSLKKTVGKQEFSAEGFVYLESPARELLAAREMARRSRAMGSTKAAEAPSDAEIASIEARVAKLDNSDRSAWRKAYCQARQLRARAHLSMLDAPLLFVKQHPYFAGHIYDDFYPWHPGGGIYVLSNPHRLTAASAVHAVIDAQTNQTLGESVYRDPDLSWDARRIVFAAKTESTGVTSLYEVGLDGSGLRRITQSVEHSDYQPAWLPDDRIVFISTRPRALVPCFNSGVGTLHTIHRDGSRLECISANNVNEFNPAVMPDGRILYGRWEYVDKTALYMQSLWTVSPDGRMEESLFANNLARPTALLDARPVPNTHQVVASLTPHNGQAVGAIASIDPRHGKNNLDGLVNFTAEYPIRMDQGLATGPCDPFPLSADDLLMSNNGIGGHGIIELADRTGHRELVVCDPEISCYAPHLVKPRQRPPVVPVSVEPRQPGRFLVTDVYQGLEGIPRGTVKQLRVVEETARTSGLPPGGRWWNQAFLVSWQGAYIVKNVLGVVPVREDGSAYFELPAGRALYFEALDADGREVQRMRTFVQAAPGVTRTCIGCHEHKLSAPPRTERPLLASLDPPSRPRPESWGSGFINYPTMIQPILDKHCVRCHGGTEDMAKGIDFTGGWTWVFSISYESLIKHRLTGFLNCHNSSVHTADLLRPRSIGSGEAKLADILVKKGDKFDRTERDLIFAWMDTNSNYYGSWDYTPYATCDAILRLKGPLADHMQKAGCTQCHATGHIGNDWVNLQTPEWSRILRAPMPKIKGSLGLAMCRDRKASTGYALVNQAVQPPDVMLPSRQPPWDPSGEPHVTIKSTDDTHYQAMLRAIRQARAEAIARPRVDMPGAEVVGGVCRMQVPPPVPETPAQLIARIAPEGGVRLTWARMADTVGLQYEIHRSTNSDFIPDESTRIGLTTAGTLVDQAAAPGRQHYVLVVTSGQQRSRPARTMIDVPEPAPLAAPETLLARAMPGEIELEWDSPVTDIGQRFDVFRRKASQTKTEKLTPEPIATMRYRDVWVEPTMTYAYHVVAVDRRGRTSPPSATVETTPMPASRHPVFTATFLDKAEARLADNSVLPARLHGTARVVSGALQLGANGYAEFEHRSEFDLTQSITVECRVFIDKPSAMPVIIACGAFNSHGWFLQQFGRGWRWHVGRMSCDGGRPVVGQWCHLVATFDGRAASLYQDGKKVAELPCSPNLTPWSGPLIVGQYSHPAPNYQVQGQIADLKIYHRALRDEEVFSAFENSRK